MRYALIALAIFLAGCGSDNTVRYSIGPGIVRQATYRYSDVQSFSYETGNKEMHSIGLCGGHAPVWNELEFARIDLKIENSVQCSEVVNVIRK